MKKLIVILLMGVPLFTAAQSLNGYVSSSVYSFQRFQTVNESSTFVRTFQQLYLNYSHGNYSLKTSVNFEGDVKTPLKNDPRLRFYNLYFEARNLLGFMRVRLGRQPLFNSVAGGLYDGINVKARKYGFELTGYYGGNVPAYQKFALTNSWKNDFVLGGNLKYRGIKNLLLQVSYVNKNFKPVEYKTERLDSLFNPIQYLVRKNSNQYEFVSSEAGYYLGEKFRANARLDYDLNFERISKVELSGRVKALKKLDVDFYYNYREPRIRYNSILSVFNYGNTQTIEGGLNYKLNESFRLVGKFGYVKYRDDNSQRITIGFYTSFGSVFYRKNLGFAGELDAISVSAAKSFLKGRLTPTFGLSYSEYKLSLESTKNKLVTIIAGLNIRPWKTFSFDIQGQYLNNKFYNNDFRIFLKVNHWFNTKLSLF